MRSSCLITVSKMRQSTWLDFTQYYRFIFRNPDFETAFQIPYLINQTVFRNTGHYLEVILDDSINPQPVPAGLWWLEQAFRTWARYSGHELTSENEHFITGSSIWQFDKTACLNSTDCCLLLQLFRSTRSIQTQMLNQALESAQSALESALRFRSRIQL